MTTHVANSGSHPTFPSLFSSIFPALLQLLGASERDTVEDLDNRVVAWILGISSPMRGTTQENFHQRLELVARPTLVQELQELLDHPAIPESNRRDEVGKLRPPSVFDKEADELYDDLFERWCLAWDLVNTLPRKKLSPEEVLAFKTQIARFYVAAASLSTAAYVEDSWEKWQTNWLYAEGRKACAAVVMIEGGKIDDVLKLVTTRDVRLATFDQGESDRATKALGLDE